MTEKSIYKQLKQLVKEFERETAERKRAEDQLQHRQAMEELIANISTSFINVTCDNVDNQINCALQSTGKFTGVDRSYINLLSEDGTVINRTYDWCAKKTRAKTEKNRKLSTESFQWLTEKLRQFETVHIPKVADLPAKAESEKKTWQAENTQSVLVIPLIMDKSLAGFLGFSSGQAEKIWLEEDIRLFRLLGEIFSRVLARKRAEYALKKSEQRYRAIVNDQNELICRFLPDTTLTFVNKSYCRYFDRNEEELLGRRFLDFIPDEEHKVIRNHLSSLTFDDYIKSYEHSVKAPEGEIRWQHWTDRAIFDKQGQLTEFQSAGHDITERKKAEEALRQAYRELKNTQAQLVQSAKLASIGQLAAGVAHELNQPLMIIRLNAQFILQGLQENDSSDNELLRQLEVIERNTTRMMDIINHLRCFSCQSHRNFQTTDINQVIENSFLMTGEQLRLHGIEVKKHLNRDIPMIMGDENQLEQVFLNLIINAKDAVTEKRDDSTKKELQNEGKLKIMTDIDENCKGFVEILVSDNGAGIPKEHVGQIFDPFFTTREVGEGMGLGLSISYGIVKDHMGDIEVVETGPEGTTFRVKLPVSK